MGPGEDQALTFRVGEARLAVAAGAIAEVFRRPKITRVPHAPASLAGVANLRGAVVPVISLAGLLGQEEAPATAASRLLLLELDEPVGVAVDEVGALTRLDPARPGIGGSRPGQLHVQGKDAVRLVDLNELLRRDFAALTRRGQGTRQAAPVPDASGPAARERVFVTFDLAGQAYALPIAEVGEVLALPPHILAMPRSDAAMLGVVALRDSLLPVVSLRVLLGFAQGVPGRNARIVVARIGAARIGLVVGRLQAILRAPPDRIEPVPAVLNRGPGEAQIQSICRLPDRVGLVSILSAERLFRDDTVAHLLADGPQQTEFGMGADAGAQEQIVVFRLGQEEYGLPVAAVDEVLRLPATLTRVPRAPGFIEGVMNHRGKVLPIIEQRRRFGVAEEGVGSQRRVIVTTIGDRQAGFVVDAVSEILSVAADRLQPTPDLAADGRRMFDRVANLDLDGRIILLVDPQELLDRAERDLLAALDGAGLARS
ncbi:chemotaxis protein CheW [Geminicoccus flavidas]|uniref:chemotaxis protein CheW n=1 Tax=Geminicoccus flavidas TaxID=2506407 RepID=UPI0013588E9A|nr:chemotaxis protein CheW [Geminicoccus flavidas]